MITKSYVLASPARNNAIGSVPRRSTGFGATEPAGTTRAVDLSSSCMTSSSDVFPALMRKLLKKQGFARATIVTDKLRSYGTTIRFLAFSAQHEQSLRKNNRAENSHQPVRRRERAMAKFRSAKSLQKFALIHSSVHNHFNQERYLYSRENFKHNRTAALAEWRQLVA